MALNQFMHPRNRYKHKKPDFAALASKYPDFKRHLSTMPTGKVTLDFKDPEALRSLTCTLLKEDFGIDLMIPLDRIIPTVPLRLNYILWIEDLLEQSGHGRSGEIYGIDVGCGASCIYPLLGAKLNSWHFAASEVDSSSAGFAAHNVKRNNLSDKIQVIEAKPDDMLHGIIKAAPRSLYHFTMCNPPFFGNLLEAQGIMVSRTADRPEPISVSTAAEGEMIWDEGGEVDFVGRLIKDSLQLREQVVWYTSMVGKKASLEPIQKELAKHKIRNVTTTEFCQGRTMRWGIGWTFYDDIKLPSSSPPKKFRREKERPPLVIQVSDEAVQHALTEASSGSKVKGGSEDQQKVNVVAKVLEKLLGTLEIDFKSKSAPKLCSRYTLTAHRNTWSNQRRRRRQLNRRLSPIEEAPPTSQTTTSRPEPNQATGGSTDILVTEVSRPTSHGQGKEQACSSDNYSIEPPQKMLKSEASPAGESGNAKINTGHMIPPEGSRKETDCSTESRPGQCVPPDGSRQETGDTLNPKVASKEPATNTSSSNMDGSESQPGQLGPPEGSRQGANCLFKCVLTVKMADGKVVAELCWKEGESREAMHQVGQYIKNWLKKMA